MKLQIRLSPSQVVSLISASYLPLLMWIYPRVAVSYAGTDAWWAVLTVVAAGVLVALIHGIVNQQFPNMTGPDMARVVYGRFLGNIVSVAYVPVYVCFLGIAVYFFIMSSTKVFLTQTPTAVLIGAMVLVSFYGAWQGVEALGRVSALIYTLAILFMSIVMFQGIFRGSISYGQWMAPTSVVRILNGTYHLLPLYLGFSVIQMLSPYYQGVRHRFWYPILSALMAGFTIVQAFAAVIMNYGYMATAKLAYPVPTLIQLLHIQGWLIERAGIVVILVSVGFTLLFISNHLWALSTLASRIFGTSDSQYKPFVIPTTLAVYLVAVLMLNQDVAYNLILTYLVPASWFVLFIEPGTRVVVWAIRVKRSRS